MATVTSTGALGGLLSRQVEDRLKKNRVRRSRAAGGTTSSSKNVSNRVADSATELPSMADLYKQQYENQEAQRKRALEATIQANNDTARKNMNQAYIQYMLQQRNLPQQLRANGINGGATETTLGDMNNTYMNNRNAIALNRANANRQARLAYDNGVSGDFGQYLTNMINLQSANYGGGGSRSSSSRSGSSAYTVPSISQQAVSSDAFTAPARPTIAPRALQVGAAQADPVNVISRLVQNGYTKNEIERIFGLGGLKAGNGVR